MHRGRRVVVVVPAGRRRYLEVLLPQVLAYDVVDEVQLWLVSQLAEDVACAESAESGDARVVLRRAPGKPRGGLHHFFAECVDADAVYVYVSDNVVLLGTADAFAAFLDFRLDHPEFFGVCGAVLNTAMVTHIQQRLGNIDILRGVVGYSHSDVLGAQCPIFAENVHFHILSHVRARADLARYAWNGSWVLYYNEHVPLDCFAWLGSEFEAFEGVVPPAVERFLATDRPRQVRKHNCIFGGFAAVRFATDKTRAHLDWTGMLDTYKQIAERNG